MSGDVQPRKRKDKKKKKDELGVEEPRGTAAALGEGDVFLHSHQDHGTGGHWCAKIIFFSLLGILITLIGLIILENRGLSELEANAVESRYSGVFEGWLEDATDDDHHDTHTLELKHHGDDDDDEHDHDDEHQFDHNDEEGHDEEEERDDEDEELDDEDEERDDEDDEQDDEDEEPDDDFDDNNDDEHADNEERADDDHYEDDDDNEDEERDDRDVGDDDEHREDQNVDADEEEGGIGSFRKYFGFGGDDKVEENAETMNKDEGDNDDEENEDNLSKGLNSDDDENDNDNDEEKEDDEKLNKQDHLSKENENASFENLDDDDNDDDDDKTLNNYNEKDDDDHDEDEDDDDEDTEVERIEREVTQEDPISMDLPVLPEDDDGDKDGDQEDADDERPGEDIDEDELDDGDKDDDFLEADDEPPIERITAPSGSPFDELEEDISTEKPPDTLKEEEEYEKKQEELRQEQEQSSHMWLKLVVGAALLAATHAVMRRATAPPDETEIYEHISREETPVINRRMTLISVPEEPSEPEVTRKASKPVEEVVKKTTTATAKYAPSPIEKSEEEEEQEDEEEELEEQEKEDEKELFSDEETEDDPEQEDEIVQARKETPKQVVPTVHEPTPDDEVGDDVEIIDDDQLEEELEDEEDDEEISDVDDAELLTRLEAKYGRLPEPDRPAPKHKDGGNSLEDEWPGEPSDSYWRQQLDSAERDLRQGEYAAAARAAGAPQLAGSARARWLLARALDAEAEARRDNRILSRAIAAYINLLKMNERLSDKKLLEIANRTLERIKFRGNYLSAEPVYRLLIRRFPDDVAYRNKLTVSYLMANRPDLADETLKETLRLWPDDRVALAHYGFVLKTQHNKLEEAVVAFQKALEGDRGPACEPRFYYHLGDALLLLGRYPEAHEVHKRGAKFGHFLSPAQRSLYNVPRLRSQPWWNVEDTPYVKLARELEKSWREILKEGLAAHALYEKEKEGLKERGEWSQLDLFVRGQEIPGRCKRAPVTCSVVKGEAAAAGCRRGQVKFSAMAPGTHVRPHVGPTNCRLRMHLGLSNTKDTYLRVDQETRQWQEGKVLLFDDSFEHEVWHNGTGERLVLIVDLWHPDLTPAERRQLPAI